MDQLIHQLRNPGTGVHQEVPYLVDTFGCLVVTFGVRARRINRVCSYLAPAGWSLTVMVCAAQS